MAARIEIKTRRLRRQKNNRSVVALDGVIEAKNRERRAATSLRSAATSEKKSSRLSAPRTTIKRRHRYGSAHPDLPHKKLADYC